jgi:hypothetical protein
MAVSSEIRTSSFGARIRFDAEYYKPFYLQRASTLFRSETIELGRIALITDGIHASPVYRSGSGIRYVSAKCVKDCVFNLSKAEEFDSDMHRKNPRTALRVGDVIISTVGTIGFCAVVDADMLPANCDRHVGIVRIYDPEQYDPHYIAAFINSTYGRIQTVRESTGNVQLNLFIYSISKIRVAFVNDYREIGNQVRSALALQGKARALYSTAQGMLEEELGIDRIDLLFSVGYTTQLSETFDAHRWDSEFYKPKYKRVAEAVLKAKKVKLERLVPIGRLLSYITNGHTPLRHDLTVGEVLFLTAEHVSDFHLDFGTDKRILQLHHNTELARTALREGDILVTIKGKVGNCAVVRNCSRAANINQDVALIRLRNGIHPYFFAAWFNSLMGKQLVEQRSTGGINPFLGLGNLRGMPFPVIDQKEQQRIGNLVQETVERAHSAEREASVLLENVKRRVEELIEQGATTDGRG